MEDNLKNQQIEALEVLMEYNLRLLRSIKLITVELRKERKSDTEEFLKSIINGVNWEIEILNRTLSLINAKKVRIQKETINENIIKFSNALSLHDDNKIADSLDDVLVMLENIHEIIKIVVSEEKVA